MGSGREARQAGSAQADAATFGELRDGFSAPNYGQQARPERGE